ncbi:nucleotide disphospho-sugar-binding domain-containing protein, partial [Streptomyces sp. 900105755]
LSLRHVPYNDRSIVPPWLYEAPRAPRVLMTFGLLAMRWAGPPGMKVEQVQESLDALADLDIELVLTVPGEVREQLREVPANTRIVDFVPLDVLLPTCSAVIHHGGAGSFNGAMTHGIPQVLLEYSVDALGKRIVLRRTGAGLSIAADDVNGRRIREHLTRLLEEDTFRAAAEQLQREALAQPTPSALVPALERLTAEHHSRRM